MVSTPRRTRCAPARGREARAGEASRPSATARSASTARCGRCRPRPATTHASTRCWSPRSAAASPSRWTRATRSRCSTSSNGRLTQRCAPIYRSAIYGSTSVRHAGECTMPDWKPEILKRLAGLKLSPTREAEIVEELGQHLEDRYRELISGGATDEQARRAALEEELGGEEILARGLRPVERTANPEPIPLGASGRKSLLASFGQDLRYGLR